MSEPKASKAEPAKEQGTTTAAAPEAEVKGGTTATPAAAGAPATAAATTTTTTSKKEEEPTKKEEEAATTATDGDKKTAEAAPAAAAAVKESADENTDGAKDEKPVVSIPAVSIPVVDDKKPKSAVDNKDDDNMPAMPALAAAVAMATKEEETDEKDKENAAATVTKKDGELIVDGTVINTNPTRKFERKGEVLKRPQDSSTVVTRNGKTWNQMFEALVEYQKQKGNTMVPDRYKNDEGVCLGLWVRNQRRRRDSLTEEQRNRLSELGLDWQTQNERFDNVWHER